MMRTGRGPENVSPIRLLARKLLPKALRHRLGSLITDVQIPSSPDRRYLRQVILPRIARRGGTVLLVGCQWYTARDPRFLKRRGVVCWTLDVDPKMAKWGSKGHHVVAPVGRATSHFGSAMFDIVVLSGVFGFGLDEVSAQAKAIEECAAILKPGGLFVLGWNCGLVDDPSTLMETSLAHRGRKPRPPPLGRGFPIGTARGPWGGMPRAALTGRWHFGFRLCRSNMHAA
jgi:SAM-dependent methyltransferase